MNLEAFSDNQRQALLDLLTAATYVDGHLASSEDERVGKLLDTMSLASDYERQQCVDASFTKASRASSSPEALAKLVADAAFCFGSPDIKRMALLALDDLLASDKKVTAQESKFLSLVKSAFERQ